MNSLLKSDLFIRLYSFLSFLLIWYIACLFVESSLLPNPNEVLEKVFVEIDNNELFYHTIITLKRVVISFIIAMIIGTVLGIFMGRKKKFDTFFDDWLVLGLNIPALVIIILSYVWFGLNETAAILAVSLNKIPMVAVIMREGSRSIDEQYVEVAKFYNIGQTKLIKKVIIPQLYPYLMSAARSGLSLIWKIVLVVELLGRSNGVGFKLYGFFQFFDISGILAYTLTFVGVILLVEFLFVRRLEKKLSKWR